MAGDDQRVYGEDRIRRLRLVLLIVVGLALVLAVFAAIALIGRDADYRRFGIVSAGLAALQLATSGLALRLLPSGSASARRAAAATGGVVVLSGIVLLGTLLSFVLPLLGLALTFMALIADEPDAPPRGLRR